MTPFLILVRDADGTLWTAQSLQGAAIAIDETLTRLRREPLPDNLSPVEVLSAVDARWHAIDESTWRIATNYALWEDHWGPDGEDGLGLATEIEFENGNPLQRAWHLAECADRTSVLLRSAGRRLTYETTVWDENSDDWVRLEWSFGLDGQTLYADDGHLLYDDPETLAAFARSSDTTVADIRAHLTTQRVADLAVALSDLDTGDDTLGVIIRQALEDDPRVTSAEIRQIVLDARQEAADEARYDAARNG